MSYTNHSGGCPGSDMTWENEGYNYGVTTVAYSFYNHVQYSKNQRKLTSAELAEGYSHVMVAEKSLKRPTKNLPPYVKNLLSRNWFQVKNSEAVYGIGTFMANKGLVNGGTGWAVQMAIDNNKPVFFFDQGSSQWFAYDYVSKQFYAIDYIPKLTENFAGIGTREITEDGINAIRKVYKNQFDNGKENGE